MSEVINHDSECLFCNIITGDIPSTKVYEDELCFAFRDIAPQAPVHVLVIPKKHIASLDAVAPEDGALVTHILSVIPRIAAAEGLQNGYRVVSNIGPDGGQTVPHLHFHIIGGAALAGRMA